MSILNNTAAAEPRYQAIRGALHTARPLTDQDKYVIMCCDGTVTRLIWQKQHASPCRKSPGK